MTSTSTSAPPPQKKHKLKLKIYYPNGDFRTFRLQFHDSTTTLAGLRLEISTQLEEHWIPEPYYFQYYDSDFEETVIIPQNQEADQPALEVANQQLTILPIPRNLKRAREKEEEEEESESRPVKRGPESVLSKEESSSAQANSIPEPIPSQQLKPRKRTPRARKDSDDNFVDLSLDDSDSDDEEEENEQDAQSSSLLPTERVVSEAPQASLPSTPNVSFQGEDHARQHANKKGPPLVTQAQVTQEGTRDHQNEDSAVTGLNNKCKTSPSSLDNSDGGLKAIPREAVTAQVSPHDAWTGAHLKEDPDEDKNGPQMARTRRTSTRQSLQGAKCIPWEQRHPDEEPDLVTPSPSPTIQDPQPSKKPAYCPPQQPTTEQQEPPIQKELEVNPVTPSPLRRSSREKRSPTTASATPRHLLKPPPPPPPPPSEANDASPERRASQENNIKSKPSLGGSNIQRTRFPRKTSIPFQERYTEYESDDEGSISSASSSDVVEEETNIGKASNNASVNTNDAFEPESQEIRKEGEGRSGNNESPTYVAATLLPTAEVKEEATRKELKQKRENVYRKYADRYLLHRHDKLGIPRLGGGHQDTYPSPVLWHKNIWDEDGKLRREYPIPRHLSDLKDGEKPKTMADFQYTAYNMLWNPKAPKYAGQPFGAVSGVPDYFLENDLAFPVFISRHRTRSCNMGWEYVGNYKVSPDKETNTFWDSETNFAPPNKSFISSKILESSKSEGGYGRRIVDNWRARLIQDLKSDDSPAEPSYMKEKREPTEDEIRAKRPPIAARARALNFSPGMSDQALVDLLVNLDEYYEMIAIHFVEYDERIYNYCKGGKTNKDRLGKRTQNKKWTPAKAGDWYDFAEQYMLMT